MAFRKDVTPAERLYLTFNELRPPFANQLVVTGRGEINKDALKNALEIAAQVNPGSALRLCGRLKSLRWVSGELPSLQIFSDMKWSGCNDIGASFLDSPLNPYSGPSCELQLIQQDNVFYLVFRSLHAVMDGMGTWLWACDVLRVLAGENPVGHGSAATDVEVARKLSNKFLALPAADANHPCGYASTETSGNGYRWQLLRLDRAYESSLLPCIALSLAKQARRYDPDANVRFNIPCDLRGFCNEATTGNMIGALFVDVTENMTVDQLVMQLIHKIYKKQQAKLPKNFDLLSWIPLFLYRVALKNFFKKEHASGKYPFTATLSNLGHIDHSIKLPSASIDNMFFIPPYADQHCFVMVNGFSQYSNIAVAVSEAFCSGNRFLTLQENILADLKN